MKNKYTKKSLSVRTTTEMDKMLKYLEGKLLLNLDADMFQLMEDIKELMEKGD